MLPVLSPLIRSRPRQTKPKKGQNEKFMNFVHFCEFWCFFLGKTSTIHIELLFRNAPAKSSWTDLSLVWFAGATPDLIELGGEIADTRLFLIFFLLEHVLLAGVVPTNQTKGRPIREPVREKVGVPQMGV